jgi:hypothetical protein
MNSVPGSFWEWAASLGPGERFTVMTLVILFIIFTTAIVAGTIYGMHKNRLEHTLKRELLDRGMSADEIATVMSSKQIKSESRRA